LHILRAVNVGDVDAAFALASQVQAGALRVGCGPFIFSRPERIVGLAARHPIPAVYELGLYAAAGGLVGAGGSLRAGYRTVGNYTGQILKGAKAAELPVVQPTKFELVINAQIAKILGLEVPPQLLASADEVIE